MTHFGLDLGKKCPPFCNNGVFLWKIHTLSLRIFTANKTEMTHMFFLKSNQNFKNRLGHAYGNSLFRLKVCFALCLFIKIALGVCLRKRLDQAHNTLFYKEKMWILSWKLLYKMCFCCDTDYNIIGHLASNERHLFCCIWDKSERKCQYGKIQATQKNA